MIINLLLGTISMLVGVAFYTLLERKFLSYVQSRKGPNKVGITGLLQPFSDALKLFNKTLTSSESMNFSLSYISPASTLLISIITISILPLNNFPMWDCKYPVILFLILSSLGVYSMLIIGWSSNTKYSNIGALRSVAQMISYEVSFFLIILFISLMSLSYSFHTMASSQDLLPFLMGNSILLSLWLISYLAEVNRSPFDFAEGESELVSGFNVDYMGGWFAFIFLAEYLSMIVLAFITISLLSGPMHSPLSLSLLLSVTLFMLWIRGTLPRFRYDMLMSLSWKIMLPLTLLILLLPASHTMTYF